jgi:hypothetical protein
MGRPYAVGPTGLGAVWVPTVTRQYKPGPMPGSVMHRIWDEAEIATTTVQLVAV